MRKITFLLGAGVGYVLGAAAGRERYDQIKVLATKAWSDPKVQESVNAAQRTVVEGAKSATASVKDAAAGSTPATPVVTPPAVTPPAVTPPTLPRP